MLTAKWLTAEPQLEGVFLCAQDSSHPPSIYPRALLIMPNVAVYAIHRTTNLEEACKCKLAPTDPSLFERTWKHVVLDSLALPHCLDRPPQGLDATLHEGSSPPKSENKLVSKAGRRRREGARRAGRKTGMVANLLPTSQPGWLLQLRRPQPPPCNHGDGS